MSRTSPVIQAWSVCIKPLAVDAVLWEAFLPDVEMKPQMRINRRINGAFHVRAFEIASGTNEVGADGTPDWTPAFGEFTHARADFIARHPDDAAFVLALENDPARGGRRQNSCGCSRH